MDPGGMRYKFFLIVSTQWCTDPECTSFGEGGEDSVCCCKTVKLLSEAGWGRGPGVQGHLTQVSVAVHTFIDSCKTIPLNSPLINDCKAPNFRGSSLCYMIG